MAIYYSSANTVYNETIGGTSGSDLYIFTLNNFGTYNIGYSSGVNSVDLTALSSSLIVNLISSSGEELSTGSGNDTISGNSLNNYIESGAGNDSISALGGSDTIIGGDGNNNINANGIFGNKHIEMGHGHNTINTGIGNDYIKTGNGHNIVEGASGDDTIETGSGNDTIYISSGDDILKGGAGNDKYVLSGTGSFGNDTIYDTAGTDSIDATAFDFNPTAAPFSRIEGGVAGDDLVITVSGKTITVINYFNEAGTGAGTGYIEDIDFADYQDITLSIMTTNGWV